MDYDNADTVICGLLCVRAIRVFGNKNKLWHETGQDKSYLADVRCIRLKMALCICFVSMGITGV